MALEGKQSGDSGLVEKSGLLLFHKEFGEFLLKAKGKTLLRNALNSTRKLLADEEMAVEPESRAMAFLDRDLGRLKEKEFPTLLRELEATAERCEDQTVSDFVQFPALIGFDVLSWPKEGSLCSRESIMMS